MAIPTFEHLTRQNIVTLSPVTPVSAAIAAMSQVRQTCVLVVEAEKTLVGIFTERDVTRGVSQQLDFDRLTLGDVMTVEPQTLHHRDIADVFQLSRLFLKKQIRHLPVVNDQHQVMGLMTPQSMRNLVKPEYLLRQLRIGDVMTANVVCAYPADSFLDVVAMMAAQSVSCVVIIDPVSEMPLGIITERDVVRFHAESQDLSVLTAGQCMTQPLVTMQPHHSLWQVHQKMQEMHVRRLVISYATGQLAGIITQTQLLRMMDPVEIHQTMQQMQSVIDRQTSELQRLNQQLKATNQDLGRQAKIDELTQVANRRSFNQSFSQLLQRSAGRHNAISLLLIDVDHFKLFNDTYGHVAGDRCLFKVAQVLKGLAQTPQDLCARYGGEEFALLLPGADLAEAEKIAQQAIQQVQKLAITHAASLTHDYVTISIGVLATICRIDSAPEALLQMADTALYEAKQTGRNRYHIATGAMNACL
ncbi:diguanylate cyclase [filamentous cyanobacterium LEGE 11480]|uniref:Diguanylate cyclase n=1 Tax=Romeriopsis navalis LEGE 11480 TaxID=2777977 RepID=A0A928VTJ9_9CYAN|nr:diguanylate cyclase [Romeriopsis navalis]MBE9032302.1 diguanylate cyclase [Romeriopsis navalis LEGE 11480]